MNDRTVLHVPFSDRFRRGACRWVSARVLGTRRLQLLRVFPRSLVRGHSRGFCAA